VEKVDGVSFIRDIERRLAISDLGLRPFLALDDGGGAYWSAALRVLPTPLMLARTVAVWTALSLYSCAMTPSPGLGGRRGTVGVAGSS